MWEFLGGNFNDLNSMISSLNDSLKLYFHIDE